MQQDKKPKNFTLEKQGELCLLDIQKIIMQNTTSQLPNILLRIKDTISENVHYIFFFFLSKELRKCQLIILFGPNK